MNFINDEERRRYFNDAKIILEEMLESVRNSLTQHHEKLCPWRGHWHNVTRVIRKWENILRSRRERSNWFISNSHEQAVLLRRSSNRVI